MRHDLQRIPFGDSAGKTFLEVTLVEIDRIVGWLEKKNMHKSWKYRDFYKAAVEYLDANKFGAGMDHEE